MRDALRQLFLDFLSAIVFLALYALTENLYLATGVAVAVSLTQIAVAKLRREQVDAMQWLVLFLVLVLGGATLLASDGRFIMLKSSISHSAIGIVMLRPGWMGRYLPPIVTDNLSKQFIVARGLLLGGVVLRARGGKSRRRVELRFSVLGVVLPHRPRRRQGSGSGRAICGLPHRRRPQAAHGALAGGLARDNNALRSGSAQARSSLH